MRDDPEYRLQYFVTQLLKFNAAKGVIFYAVPNGEYRSKRTLAKLKGMGVRAGVADIAFVLPGGRAAFLELKSPRGYPSAEQKIFRADVEATGALYAIARTQKEVEDILASWGALRAKRQPMQVAA
jgi:hypothetical protein